MSKGKFIVFEGLDCCGKSTQIRLLIDYLSKHNIVNIETVETSSHPIGALARQGQEGKQDFDFRVMPYLYAADRMDNITNPDYGLLHYLNSGVTVVQSRTWLTSFAFNAPHVGWDTVYNLNKIAMSLVEPDLLIYMDIKPEESIRRIERYRNSKDRYDKLVNMKQAHMNYARAIKEYIDPDKLTTLDALKPIKFNQSLIQEKVKQILSI